MDLLFQKSYHKLQHLVYSRLAVFTSVPHPKGRLLKATWIWDRDAYGRIPLPLLHVAWYFLYAAT